MTDQFSLNVYLSYFFDKKPENLVVLDLRNISSITDFFIICHGNSNRQVVSIARHVKNELKKIDIKPISIDGLKEGHWVLLDYGMVVMHVFYKPIRDLYDLEGCWSDARKISLCEKSDFKKLSIFSIDVNDKNCDCNDVFIK